MNGANGYFNGLSCCEPARRVRPSLVLGELDPFEPDIERGSEVGRVEVGLAVDDDVEEGGEPSLAKPRAYE